MSTDVLKCSVAALIDQADFTARELRSTAAQPKLVAHFPESFGSLTERSEALADLSRRCRRELVAARSALTMVTLPYLDARPVLTSVAAWAADLRLKLDDADLHPEGHRLATQVRAGLRADLRRVAGTVAMLNRTLPQLERLASDLTPWCDARAFVARAQPLLDALETCQDGRAKEGTRGAGVFRSKRSLTDELRTMMRNLRRRWASVVINSGGKVPPLDLTIATTDLANRPAWRKAKGGLDTAEVGLSTAEIGLDTAAVGPGTAKVGLGTAEVGLATAEVGLDTAEVGLGAADPARGS